MTNALRLVFMGTPTFAVVSLEALLAAGHRPVACVTSPDAPGRRGKPAVPSPVKRVAQQHGIPVLEPESVKAESFADALRELEPDLFVVVAFKILPPAVLALPKLGAFNVHGSLLPRYRGAAPIQRAVMAGDAETGVTTFALAERVDTGGILLRATAPIGADDTAGDVHDRLMHLGARLAVETVRLYAEGVAIPLPQDDRLATPAPKLFREEGRIDWGWPASRLHNHIRGFSPFPGAWTPLASGGDLKVLRTTRVDDVHGTPGCVMEVHPHLVVACAEGALRLVEVQPAGRKAMTGREFALGERLSVGELLPPT